MGGLPYKNCVSKVYNLSANTVLMLYFYFDKVA